MNHRTKPVGSKAGMLGVSKGVEVGCKEWKQPSDRYTSEMPAFVVERKRVS